MLSSGFSFQGESVSKSAWNGLATYDLKLTSQGPAISVSLVSVTTGAEKAFDFALFRKSHKNLSLASALTTTFPVSTGNRGVISYPLRALNSADMLANNPVE